MQPDPARVTARTGRLCIPHTDRLNRGSRRLLPTPAPRYHFFPAEHDVTHTLLTPGFLPSVLQHAKRGAAAERHSRAQLRSAPHAALRQRALRPARRRQLQRRSRGGAVCLKIETPPLRLSLPSRFSPPTTFIKFSSLIHACSRADVTFFFSPLIRKRAMKHKLSLQRTSPALLPDFYFQSQRSANIHYPQNPKTSSNRNMRVAFRAERKYSASWVTVCPLVRPSAAQPTGIPAHGEPTCSSAGLPASTAV